jgi:N utilization substance protein B
MVHIDKLAQSIEVSEQTPQGGDPRRLARQLALQFLYQLTVQGGANLDQMDSFLAEYSDNVQIREMAARWIKGAWQQVNQIDLLIRQTSANWDLSRISKVDHSNLQLAAYQMINCPEIPTKVVINEAVELAKTFSTAQAPAFINGVLEAIKKKITDKTDGTPGGK